MARGITLVTPSFSQDYERFVFQRESMARCGITIPHVVIVHDDDVGLFRNAPYSDGLAVLSSAEVLPPEVERLRRESGTGGWYVQQLTKLAAADVVPGDYVCVDSDTFWVRPIGASDFRADSGELYLFEHQWLSAELVLWLSKALTLFGVDRGQKVEPASWVYPIVPLVRSLVRNMRTDLEQRLGVAWWRVMLDDDALVEYSVYGVYARYVRHLDGVVPVDPELCVSYWKPEYEDIGSLAEEVEARGAKAGMVHSGLHLSPEEYRSAVERAWRAIPG